MTYYLKYRPQTLNELDNVSARSSLLKLVASGNIPHAFLFSGPKGTGKTSAARIMAKIINCEQPDKDKNPCNICDQCLSIIKGSNLDVVEMDAASNRGIDDIRSLRDSVKLSPAKAKKKIYIIDEVHMLTLEASNALLKTLEEPPSHVVFFLATTNPEKLIKTIRSRVTEIGFKKASGSEINTALEKIITGEKLKVDDDIISLIAENSDGSFRDATKLLEQAVIEEIKSKEEAEKWLTGKSGDTGFKIMTLLKKGNSRKIIEEIEGAVSSGSSVKNIIEEMLKLAKESILAKSGLGEDFLKEIDKKDLFYLVELLLKAEEQTNISTLEQLPLEIALIKWCDEVHPTNTLKEEEENEEEEEDKGGVKKALPLDDWKKVLDAVRPLNTSIEALLRAAKPISFDGKTLVLGVYYRFHKERLEEDKYRRLLEDVVSKVFSINAKVNCTLTEPPKKEVIQEKVYTRSVSLQEPNSLLTKKVDDDIIELAKKMFSN